MLVTCSTVHDVVRFVITRAFHSNAQKVSHPLHSVFILCADVASQCNNERVIQLILLASKPSQRVVLTVQFTLPLLEGAHGNMMPRLLTCIVAAALLQPRFQPAMFIRTNKKEMARREAVLSGQLPMGDHYTHFCPPPVLSSPPISSHLTLPPLPSPPLPPHTSVQVQQLMDHYKQLAVVNRVERDKRRKAKRHIKHYSSLLVTGH